MAAFLETIGALAGMRLDKSSYSHINACKITYRPGSKNEKRRYNQNCDIQKTLENTADEKG